MRVGIIIYAFMMVEPLDNLLAHVLKGSYSVYLFRHSENSDVKAVCEKYANYSNVNYYPYGVNRGLARSVNEGLIDGYQRDKCDVMITANDDILPGEGDIDKIATAAYHNRDRYLVEGMGIINSQMGVVEWALAAINPIALEKVGYFDENFFPAYYEDVDYRYRGRLAGLKTMVVEDTHIRHIGSASVSFVDADQHEDEFMRNQAHYLRKWGGEKGHENFIHPFNDPAASAYIAAENRHTPYPGHDRTDKVVA